jgi:hypothetical protein
MGSKSENCYLRPKIYYRASKQFVSMVQAIGLLSRYSDESYGWKAVVLLPTETKGFSSSTQRPDQLRHNQLHIQWA